MSVKLDPAGFHRRIPLAPHQLRERVTPSGDVIVLCHLGVPRIDKAQWSLTIDGLVERPLTLTFGDLARFPTVTVASVHQCAGSPLQPHDPTRRICNVVWSGVRLSDVLGECGVRETATFVWSYGADFGEFSGQRADCYLKDLPLSRLRDDVLIATGMNGEPLDAEHGFPARLVVPGFYGTNSTKWLTRLTLADQRAESPFTTRWYNDPVLDASGNDTGKTTPVWSIAPESVLVSPAPDDVVSASKDNDIWGWAWADGGVASVDVSFDDGASWISANVDPADGRQWQRFSLSWRPPHEGAFTLTSRARSKSGAEQPLSGWRNAIHRVAVTARRSA